MDYDDYIANEPGRELSERPIVVCVSCLELANACRCEKPVIDELLPEELDTERKDRERIEDGLARTIEKMKERQ